MINLRVGAGWLAALSYNIIYNFISKNSKIIQNHPVMNKEDELFTIEKELITNFLEEFYSKTGYYPTVYGKYFYKPNKQRMLTLKELFDSFEPFLPTKYGEKHNLNSKLRIKELVELRCIYCYISRKMGYKLKEIGYFIGKRDHTTIIHNLRSFKDWYDVDEKFRNKYYTILNHIKQTHESSIMDNTNQMEDQPG